jgi:hypothetical protein
MIGFAGFIAYGIPAFFFDVTLIGGLFSGKPLPGIAPLLIVATLGAFFTWRAVAGLIQAFG